MESYIHPKLSSTTHNVDSSSYGSFLRVLKLRARSPPIFEICIKAPIWCGASSPHRASSASRRAAVFLLATALGLWARRLGSRSYGPLVWV